MCNACPHTAATVSNTYVPLDSIDKLPVAQCQFLTFMFQSCLPLNINLSLFDQGHCAQYLEKTLQQGAIDVSSDFNPPGIK